MKFLKKAGVFLLALSLIPSFSALAETSQSYVDNLNKYTTDTTMPWSGYGNATYASDVFVQNSGNGGFIDADGGPDGTAALKMTQKTDGNNVALKTRTADFGEAEQPVLTHCYDMKIMANAADANKNIFLGGNANGQNTMFKITTENDVWKLVDQKGVASSYAYTLDRWYKVVMVSSGNGSYAHIIDSETGELVISSVDTSAVNMKNFTALYVQPSSGTQLFTVMLDNVILTMYDAANDAPEIVSASVETDSKNVPRNQELTFTFDQELDDSSIVNLTQKDGTPVDGAKTEKTGYNTLTVTYDGILEKGTEYVLSFEGVTNGAIYSPDSAISFTTEKLHLWNDVEVSSAAANEDNADLTDITFTIGDEYGYSVFTGSVMAAVYQDGKMIALDMQPLTNADTGEITVSFDLGTLPTDAKIGLILLDVEDGPIPLSGGTLEN
ncbi:MAG: Ig-like domain-containing protein [Clostridia bacterium]|nr:Ig-like domain-containing protein [Clostridia bacterium]